MLGAGALSMVGPTAWTSLTKLHESDTFIRPLLTGVPYDGSVIPDLGTAIYTAASLDDDSTGFVYDPKCVAICWHEEAQIVTSEHERFSADLIVVKCTLRAAFGVPDEHGVVKMAGLPHPTTG